MKQPKFKILFLFLFSIFLSSKLFSQETEIVNKLNDVIKPINTLNPDSSFNDIDFLSKILQEKEIISLGEATHGTKEIYAYKDRLIRYLVSNLNHKAIAFEADYSGLEQIDNYINWKIESTTMSPNYKPLFTWLREYNKTKSEQNKVHVYGLEIREFNGAIDKELSSNKDINQSDKEVLLKIRNTQFDKIDNKSLNDFRMVCTRLPKTLNSKMLIQLIDNYHNFIGTSPKIGFRDKYMAENAIAIKESTNDKRLIIWAHNGHVAKTSLYNKPAMGEYLDKAYSDKHYVIATDINKGNVSVRKFIAKNKPVSDSQSLYYSEVDSNKGYEYYFKQCKYKNFILDVHAAILDNQLSSFLTQQKEMRLIGAFSIPVNKKLSIANNFDMIVYFDETNSL
nr:erythromycin esterase family protein [Pedobacter panaciterrae]